MQIKTKKIITFYISFVKISLGNVLTKAAKYCNIWGYFLQILFYTDYHVIKNITSKNSLRSFYLNSTIFAECIKSSRRNLLGSMLSPFLAGVLTDEVGIDYVFWFLCALDAGAVLVSIIINDVLLTEFYLSWVKCEGTNLVLGDSVGYRYLFQVLILFDTSFRYQIQISILFDT